MATDGERTSEPRTNGTGPGPEEATARKAPWQAPKVLSRELIEALGGSCTRSESITCGPGPLTGE